MTGASMLRLENPIQNYAWGSHSAISKLLGSASPSEKPEAELWLGAHPKAPSRVLPSRESLATLIEREPARLLGTELEARYGACLPFLLKVLAAETPLSLQAHPTIAQAQTGFAAEEAARVPLDSAERNYKDKNHKPELLCALTPFAALCGFRNIADTLELFRALRAPLVSYVIEILEQLPTEAGLAQVFSTLMTASPERRAELAQQTLDRCTELAAFEGPFQKEFSWAVRIGVLYPRDIGIVTALLLNLVRLAPGEAIYLPAGNLHAYLQGMGMEIMANSDNVLRGGLTPKHVDVAELTRVLDFRAGPASVLHGEAHGGARIYRTPAPEFELQSFELYVSEERTVTDRRGPEIVFCEHGSVELECARDRQPLAQGQALFIAAAEPGYVIRGEGRLFRASVGRS
ncbi:MAG TPA: mannose-6-phosphate isomerase, class I [Polyangiaceae bacterium]|nr:mannose-6-phosphate isomerase, class I [Polyangiaceae bacterium]